MSKIVPQDEEIVEQIKLLRDAVPPIIGYKKVEGTSPPSPSSPENNDVTFDLTPFSTFIFQRVFRGSSRGGTLV